MRQNALAEALAVTPQTLSGWLNGPKTPSADQLLKMADFLDVSLDKLMGRVPGGCDALVQLRQHHAEAARALDRILPPDADRATH